MPLSESLPIIWIPGGQRKVDLAFLLFVNTFIKLNRIGLIRNKKDCTDITFNSLKTALWRTKNHVLLLNYMCLFMSFCNWFYTVSADFASVPVKFAFVRLRQLFWAIEVSYHPIYWLLSEIQIIMPSVSSQRANISVKIGFLLTDIICIKKKYLIFICIF